MPILISDTFTGTNNTQLKNHALDVNPNSKQWIQTSFDKSATTWTISSNHATCTTGDSIAVIDSGQSDCTVQAVLFSTGLNPQIVFRYNPTTGNYFYAEYGGAGFDIYYVEAGVNFLYIDSVSQTVSAGDTIKVELIGQTINLYRNSTKIKTTSSALNQSSTYHGIGTGWGGSVLDDFQVSTGGSSYPICSIVSTSKPKISDEVGKNQTIITFKFDKDVVQWIAKLNGSDNATGTTVDSGTTLSANTNATATIDWNEGLSEGQNRINIYGKLADGTWTQYNS